MRQRVDPFIPVRKPMSPSLQGPYGTQYFAKRPLSPPRSMDGIQQRPPVIRPPLRPRPLMPIKAPLVKPKPPQPKHPTTKHRIQLRPKLTKTPLLVWAIGAVCFGLFIQSLIFGELAIVIYIGLSLWRRISSSKTYILALITLVTTGVSLAIHGGPTMLSNNFAVYAFLLLLGGTLSLAREVRHENQ
ncbi:MAG TPA: hypothetical protein VGS08_01160 [Candidatus Saccharimonadales bacterium]|nr:hypothetical protein [Candidatus Saccharimonadales bacterium]